MTTGQALPVAAVLTDRQHQGSDLTDVRAAEHALARLKAVRPQQPRLPATS